MASRKELETLTRKRLLEVAKSAGVAGAQKLTKSALVDAILKVEAQRAPKAKPPAKGAKAKETARGRARPVRKLTARRADRPTSPPTGAPAPPDEAAPATPPAVKAPEPPAPSTSPSPSPSAASFTEQCLALLAVDPWRVHAIWDLSPDAIEIARETCGARDAALVLRVREAVAGAGGAGEEPRSWEAPVGDVTGSWAMELPAPGLSLEAEVGLRVSQDFLPLLSSNALRLPPAAAPGYFVDERRRVRGMPPALWKPRSPPVPALLNQVVAFQGSGGRPEPALRAAAPSVSRTTAQPAAMLASAGGLARAAGSPEPPSLAVRAVTPSVEFAEPAPETFGASISEDLFGPAPVSPSTPAPGRLAAGGWRLAALPPAPVPVPVSSSAPAPAPERLAAGGWGLAALPPAPVPVPVFSSAPAPPPAPAPVSSSSPLPPPPPVSSSSSPPLLLSSWALATGAAWAGRSAGVDLSREGCAPLGPAAARVELDASLVLEGRVSPGCDLVVGRRTVVPRPDGRFRVELRLATEGGDLSTPGGS